MTTEVNDRTERYIVTDEAGQSIFDITFPLENVAFLRAYIDGELSDISDYSIDLDSLTLTYNDPVPQNSIVTLEGYRLIARENDYPLRGDLRSSRLNYDMDAIIRTLQELRRDIDAAFILNKAEDVGVSSVMPRLSPGRVIVWGVDGLENGPPTDGIDDLVLIKDDIVALAGVKDGIPPLAALTVEISALYVIRDDIADLGGVAADVALVAANIDNIDDILDDLKGDNHIGTVAAEITAVSNVSFNMANVVAVGGDLAGANHIGAVAGDLVAVVDVSNNMASVIAAVPAAISAADSANAAAASAVDAASAAAAANIPVTQNNITADDDITYTLDYADGALHQITVESDFTLAFDFPANVVVTMVVDFIDGDLFSITWPAGCEFPDGTAPVFGAGKSRVVVLQEADGTVFATLIASGIAGV